MLWENSLKFVNETSISAIFRVIIYIYFGNLIERSFFNVLCQWRDLKTLTGDQLKNHKDFSYRLYVFTVFGYLPYGT